MYYTVKSILNPNGYVRSSSGKADADGCTDLSSTLEGMENTLIDRSFRDSEGKLVLAQMPNLPILVWVAASSLQLILTSGKIYTGLDLVAFGSLFTWAWLELFQGVNYFRRALGFIVLLGAIASRLDWS